MVAVLWSAVLHATLHSTQPLQPLQLDHTPSTVYTHPHHKLAPPHSTPFMAATTAVCQANPVLSYYNLLPVGVQ